MLGIDFDFARYVAYRRGMVEQRARDGGAYSYVGERKVRRALVSARPVNLAIEATLRLWKNVAKKDLLGPATRVTDQEHPRVYAATQRACLALGLKPPPVYVAPNSSSIAARALGTDDEPYVVINADLIDRLSDPELVALVGHELGHVQNNHIVYTTALYYLQYSAVLFVRWIVKPAIMALQAWSRRAEITCDRASLICTRDLDAALASMIKVSLGPDESRKIDVAEYLAQLPETRRGVGKYGELFRSYPYLSKRVEALRLFASSQFYRKLIGDKTPGGMPAEDVDMKVSEILSLF